ncbi:hypothetical protein ACLOJK_034270 [Asimina triloba]
MGLIQASTAAAVLATAFSMAPLDCQFFSEARSVISGVLCLSSNGRNPSSTVAATLSNFNGHDSSDELTAHLLPHFQPRQIQRCHHLLQPSERQLINIPPSQQQSAEKSTDYKGRQHVGQTDIDNQRSTEILAFKAHIATAHSIPINRGRKRGKYN